MQSHFSCVRLCVTPQTAVHQAPPSLGFSRQEYWTVYEAAKQTLTYRTVFWTLGEGESGNWDLGEWH